jgi:hypothetical protein
MMNIWRWILPVTAALMLGFSGMSAQAAKAAKADKPDKNAGTGTVSGKVVDKDGKAVAGATVHLVKPEGRKAGKQAAADNKGDRTPPVAKTKTDKDGKFSMTAVPAGAYRVIARSEGKGRGNAQVTVETGKTAEVALTLGDVPPGGGRKGGAK